MRVSVLVNNYVNVTDLNISDKSGLMNGEDAGEIFSKKEVEPTEMKVESESPHEILSRLGFVGLHRTVELFALSSQLKVESVESEKPVTSVLDGIN